MLGESSIDKLKDKSFLIDEESFKSGSISSLYSPTHEDQTFDKESNILSFKNI